MSRLDAPLRRRSATLCTTLFSLFLFSIYLGLILDFGYLNFLGVFSCGVVKWQWARKVTKLQLSVLQEKVWLLSVKVLGFSFFGTFKVFQLSYYVFFFLFSIWILLMICLFFFGIFKVFQLQLKSLQESLQGHTNVNKNSNGWFEVDRWLYKLWSMYLQKVQVNG